MSNPYQSPESSGPPSGAGAWAAPSPTMPRDFQDKSSGLTLFGVFQILIGCVCVFFALGALLFVLVPMPVAAQNPALNARMMIPGVIVYVKLAVAFIWLGIGSILARRWAQTLTVILSWLWLAVGVTATIAIVIMMPMIGASMQQQQAKIPPQMVVVVQVITGVVTTAMYILLPAAFLWFYQRASVRATCQWRDPQTRWTDRCPAPVLAVSIVLAYLVIWTPTTAAINGGVLPFFGRLISGGAGAAVSLLLMLLSAVLCWGTYRLKMAAWWGVLLLWITGTVSAALTSARVGLMETYERMGFSAPQLEMLKKAGFAQRASTAQLVIGVLAGIAILGYLLYVRRYFVRSEAG